jgi:hypothetical protein
MPRKAKSYFTGGAVLSSIPIYRDAKGRFVSGSHRRGVYKSAVYVDRDERGRYISPIVKMLRSKHFSEAEIARVQKQKPLAKLIRLQFEYEKSGGKWSKDKRRIKFQGEWYYPGQWRRFKQQRTREIKLAYYQSVLGVSKREATKLLKYILEGGKGDPVLDAMRKRVGSPVRKRVK